MNKLRTRWAASIAGLAVTSGVQAAEINFDLHAIDTPGAAPDTGALRHIIRNQAKTSRTALGIVESITQQLSPTHEIHLDEDAGSAVSTGPVTTLPAASTNPVDHHFFGYLSLKLSSGYIHDSVAYWPVTIDEATRPLLLTESDDFQYSFILESSYVTDYWPDQGQFSWPVTLHMAAFDNNILTAEVNGAEAFAYLDSTEGHFRLSGQVTTLDGSAITLSVTSTLALGEGVHPDLIEPLLSIKIGNAAEQLSVPELRLILTGNQQSDIAGQFNNFASSENISDILTIIGQFSSVSGLRK